MKHDPLTYQITSHQNNMTEELYRQMDTKIGKLKSEIIILRDQIENMNKFFEFIKERYPDFYSSVSKIYTDEVQK